MAPQSARMIGVELDPTTASIAAALYPHATIRTESFAQTPYPAGYFDATVGNVPFADVRLHDPRHNRANHSLHNHCIIKSLALTRPGGIVAVLTSRYTLDARNPAARREMNAMADLVGAVRLPSGAHMRAAGTQVVTDLLILRRREPGTEPVSTAWEQSRTLDLGEGEDLRVNAYFDEHPEHVLGAYATSTGQFGAPALRVVAGADTDVGEDLARALADITAHARRESLTMTAAGGELVAERAANTPAPGLWDGHLEAQPDGSFTRVLAGEHVPLAVPASQSPELRALLGLRDAAKDLLSAEADSIEDTDATRALRSGLAGRYAAYTARYGPINRFSVRSTGRTDPETGEPRMARVVPRVMHTLRSDPFAPLVMALESFDEPTQTAVAATMLTQRTLVARAPVLGVDSPLTVNTGNLSDGEYVLAVSARDAAGNQEERTRTIVVDRQGDVYQADLVTGQPGGSDTETLAREWGMLTSARARSQDESQIQTRQPTRCVADDPDSGQCEEVRTRLLTSENGTPAEQDTFETYIGDGPDDPRLDAVASISQPAERIVPEDLKRTGPIAEALADWQAPPPVAGAQYEYYERTRQVTIPPEQQQGGQDKVTIVHGLWVDATTKMPLKASTSPIDVSGGSETMFWAYRLDRQTVGELPADHFGVPSPEQPSQTKTVTYTGSDPVGPLVDRETGMPFFAYTLGLKKTLGSLGMCLASNWTVTQDVMEPDDTLGSEAEGNDDAPSDEQPDPIGIRTDVSAHYNSVTDLASCLAGRGSLDVPDLSITSSYAQSTDALALRKAHGVGDAIPDEPTTRTVTVGGQEVTAYIVETGDGISVYAQIGQTAVVVNGQLAASLVPTLFSALELM